MALKRPARGVVNVNNNRLWARREIDSRIDNDFFHFFVNFGLEKNGEK
jgi:hypothetical protein